MQRSVRLLVLAIPLLLGAAALEAWAGPGCGGCGARHGHGNGACAGRHGGCGSAAMAEARDTFHALLGDHDKIRRTVEEIEGGVATTTVSEDPATAAMIRKHVRQMQARLAAGEGLRHWDPLFVEIFEHHDEIAMTVEDLPGGVKVKETSENPDVVKLIRAHARAVSEFTARGFDRAREATPLPSGYGTPAEKPAPAALKD